MKAEDEANYKLPAALLRAVPDKLDPRQPDKFVQAVHGAWKSAGGTLAGKPRHSDRFLSEQLRAHDAEVRSLTPKLAGRTRIRAEDAEALLRYFLSNWPQREKDADALEGESVTYAALLSQDEIEEIVNSVTEASDTVFYRSPSETDDRSAASLFLPGEDSFPLLARMYKECDALYTVATATPLVTREPRTELIGFRNLMNVFRDIEDSDGNIRPLIWVLDMGRQIFEDLESRLRFLGLQELVTRFRALRLFDDADKEARWEWLQSRAIFIVLDTKYEQNIEVKGIRRPSFLGHNVSLNAIPPSWAVTSNFRTLYGSELERLEQRTFNVFYKAKGWPMTVDDNEDHIIYRRYFGFASFASDTKPNAPRYARGLELPSPGDSYDVGFRTVYAAATELLNLKNRQQNPIAGKDAIAQLRFLGFRLLKLPEFMTF